MAPKGVKLDPNGFKIVIFTKKSHKSLRGGVSTLDPVPNTRELRQFA